MDVLRLAGVPGVGKSTIGWAIARRLAEAGERCGYVDIDQLGMCYPAPTDDPDRWTLKESMLVRVAAQFQRAGIGRLVVSGVADPAAEPPRTGQMTTSLWLDAAAATRRERLASRGWPSAQLEAVVAVGDDESSRARPSWTRLATDGRTAPEIADAVLDLWSSAPPAEGIDDRSVEDSPVAAPGRVIWITGPRCVGASRVGWEIASSAWRAEQRTGFVDVAQLDFAWNVERGVGLRNAIALQRGFADAGAGMLVAVAPFAYEPSEVQAAFGEAEVSFVRLHADDEVLRERAVTRATAGGGVQLAGDDLAGASDAALAAIVEEGRRQRRAPLRPGERLVDATAATPAATAALVLGG